MRYILFLMLIAAFVVLSGCQSAPAKEPAEVKVYNAEISPERYLLMILCNAPIALIDAEGIAYMGPDAARKLADIVGEDGNQITLDRMLPFVECKRGLGA